MKCLIIDSDPVPHKTLEFHIGDIEWLTLVGNCYNTLQGIEAIKEFRPDIVFFNTSAPEMRDLEMWEYTPSLHFKAILIVSKSQHELTANDPRIMGFLYMPISFNQFFDVINKLRL